MGGGKRGVGMMSCKVWFGVFIDLLFHTFFLDGCLRILV
jgi:hypothetical protein